MDKSKMLSWQALCLMTFTSVWSFGNIVNGFANQGLKVIISWILMFSLYFIPYTLMEGKWVLPLKAAVGALPPGSAVPVPPAWPTLRAGPTG